MTNDEHEHVNLLLRSQWDRGYRRGFVVGAFIACVVTFATLLLLCLR